MKTANLKTKIFLDSGDPAETRQALDLLGFLDGQTTNPSLIAKNPATAGKKFSKNQLTDFYKGVVREVSSLIPRGSVSIEVYADQKTSAEQMLEQGRQFFKWIPNAHIKYPITKEGLKAAEISVKEGMRVNMTLVFSQEQAAAVYAATLNQSLRSPHQSSFYSSGTGQAGTGQAKGAKKGDARLPTPAAVGNPPASTSEASRAGGGQVFLSPFVGRLDDRGEQGMDLIKNIIRMYHPPLTPPVKGGETADSHVEVLVASVRSLEHFMRSIELGADIITTPLKILKEWAAAGFPLPLGEGQPALHRSQTTGAGGEGSKLRSIPYQEINLTKPWQQHNIHHDLTDKGIEKFAADWNSLIE